MSTRTMCGGVEESSDEVGVALVVAGSLRQNAVIDIDHDNPRLDTVEERQCGGPPPARGVLVGASRWPEQSDEARWRNAPPRPMLHPAW